MMPSINAQNNETPSNVLIPMIVKIVMTIVRPHPKILFTTHSFLRELFETEFSDDTELLYILSYFPISLLLFLILFLEAIFLYGTFYITE